MNVQGRIILLVLAGIAAGLLTWFVSDLSGLIHLPDRVSTMTAGEYRQQQAVGMVFGGLVGAFLGAAGGLALGSTAQVPRAAGIGLLVGLASGLVGLTFGQALFGALYIENATNPLSFIWNVIARATGWAFIGALTGTAEGWRKWSVRVGRNGFIGGLLGGMLGGITFEIIPYLVPGLPPGILSRLAGFVITGAAIGLFVALVQELLKEAWIRVLVGRNEGKEFLVDKEETRIGRAELSDVPLFGDPSIARTHAVLLARPGGHWFLRDEGSPTGTLVNGKKLAGETGVRNGDEFQIGSRTLVFYERLTARRTAPAPRDVARPRPASGVMAAPMGGPAPLRSLADSLPAPAESAGRMAGTAGVTAVRAPAETRMVATSGPHLGTTFMLEAETVIGRDPGNQIPLPHDEKTSRRHARLHREGAGYTITDMGSTNGTYVNGRKIATPQPLMPGDTVLVGATALRFE